MKGVSPTKLGKVGVPSLGVPKLDLQNVKGESAGSTEDWQNYATKLEESVKYQRNRVKMVEKDLEVLNEKFRTEMA
jgi:hypothetical protein